MKKVLAGLGASAIMVGSTVLPVFAAGPYIAIPNTNPAFGPSPYGSIQNENNTALRFGSGGGIAIPGAGGQYASDSSVIAPYSTGGSQSIVRPGGAF